jgi:hypothetical protein
MGCISSMIRPGEGRIVNEKRYFDFSNLYFIHSFI